MGRKYTKRYKPYIHGRYAHGGGLAGVLLGLIAGRHRSGGHYPRGYSARPSLKHSIVMAILRRILRRF